MCSGPSAHPRPVLYSAARACYARCASGCQCHGLRSMPRTTHCPPPQQLAPCPPHGDPSRVPPPAPRHRRPPPCYCSRPPVPRTCGSCPSGTPTSSRLRRCVRTGAPQQANRRPSLPSAWSAARCCAPAQRAASGRASVPSRGMRAPSAPKGPASSSWCTSVKSSCCAAATPPTGAALLSTSLARRTRGCGAAGPSASTLRASPACSGCRLGTPSPLRWCARGRLATGSSGTTTGKQDSRA
mmetsp:Transcript_27904/g.90176  ORF Transcript_27904/g.90176 Transcript_27904/m.90176 type:complete len:241 (-) Transcript_27904:744-1466(-)